VEIRRAIASAILAHPEDADQLRAVEANMTREIDTEGRGLPVDPATGEMLIHNIIRVLVHGPSDPGD
jgi:hypothetical protein